MFGGSAARFLVASGISFYGDWLTNVALVVLLFRLTGSATGPALYMLFRVAPRVLGAAPGGALADRYGPVRVATVCAAVQGLLTALIVVFAHAGAVWGIYLAVAFSQLLSSVAQPAYGALPPRLVSQQQLGRINGIFGALFASSIVVSPAIGAVLLTRTSPEWLIVVDAASFLIAALLLVTLRPVALDEGEAHSPKGFAAGLPIVFRDSMLRSLAAGWLANCAVITALQAVLVVAASQHFGSDVDVGWLYVAVGAGGLFGALPVIRKTPTNVRRGEITAATLLEMAPLALFVVVTNLPLALALLFFSSLAGTVYQTRGWVGLQQRVPPDVLGRTTAVIRFAMYLGMLIGAVAAVTLVQITGWQAAVVYTSIGGFAVLIAATIFGPSKRRTDSEFQEFLNLPVE
jgi:predicted MFS family arabinose efflux permease